MLIDCDASQLEVCVACEVSRDRVLWDELLADVDRHSENAKEIFGDIKYRQEAKSFSFALQYGATPYMFYADPKFPNFSLSTWEHIVEAYYEKYKGLKAWQDLAYKQVCETGQYLSPTGRIYKFKKALKDGSWEYKRSEVVNYPIQGLATGDVMPLFMIHLMAKLKKVSPEILMINQVHDSVIIDCPDIYLDVVAETALVTFEDVPNLVKKQYGYDWKVRIKGEIQYGNDWSSKTKYERSPF